ncbi:MAG: hypothetical protein PHR77_00840 [Kiritimatiellae bacterium]|nr:hypothetical protein [Kiritimatiellia bacterium]MDD5522503.1 hypothetical protein [Kiritimatiellia bacterium]
MQKQTPGWNPADPAASLKTYAKWIRGMAVNTFLSDKTHAELFFFIKATGPSSVFPVPPKTDRKEVISAIRQAILKDDIYGIIHIAEAWTYTPSGMNDHTARQILDGEMSVSALNKTDKREALLVSFESREGICEVWSASILRDDKKGVTLGGDMRRIKNSWTNWERLFG